MKMELHEIGVERLIAGIYRQAAKDYIQALVTNNKGQKMILKKFMISGAYDVKPETGQYIINNCEKEVAISEKIIESFLNSDSESIELEPNISIPVLRHVVAVLYKKDLYVECVEDDYFLRKK